MHRYTGKEKDFIKLFAFGHSYTEIMEETNKRFCSGLAVNQIRAYLKNNKICTGRTGRFESGHVPANKGTHNGGWEPTQFKKGCVPHNHKPIGSERIDSKDGYLLIKTEEPKTWKLKHRVIWEKYYGTIQRGKVVIFLDGNKLNTDIENLCLIDKKINVRMNQLGLRFEDRDSTEAAIHVAELVSKIAEAKKR